MVRVPVLPVTPILIILGLGFKVMTAEPVEILYERKPTEEELKKYQIKQTWQRYFGRNDEKVDEFRKFYRERKWEPQVIKAEFFYSSKEHNLPVLPRGYQVPVDGTPFLQLTYLSEILYEHPLTPEEKERYEILGSGSSENRTFEEIRAEYRDRKSSYQGNTFKVELNIWAGWEDMRNDSNFGVFPHLDVWYLGDDKIKAAEGARWVEEASPRLGIGKDYKGFKYQGVRGNLTLTPNIYFRDESRIGMFTHAFVYLERGHVTVYLYETLGDTIDIHNFLRVLIRNDNKMKNSDYGPVVFSKPTKYALAHNLAVGEIVGWLSGDRHAIYMWGRNEVAQELLPFFAERFPSTLPKKIDFDRVAWARDEMDVCVEKMRLRLEQGDRLRDAPEFSFYLNTMAQVIRIPAYERPNVKPPWVLPLEQKWVFFNEVADWCRANKDNLTWDEKKVRVVLKGETADELAAAKKRHAEQEREARLNAPLTEEALAQIKQKLIEDFQKRGHDWMNERTKDETPEWGTKFVKIHDGSWEIHFRQSLAGELTIRRYTGPKLVKLSGKEWPLKGVFEYTTTDLPGRVLEESHYYNKLMDRWFSHDDYNRLKD